MPGNWPKNWRVGYGMSRNLKHEKFISGQSAIVMPLQRTNGRWPKGKANGEKRPNAVERWQKASSANSTVLKQIWMISEEYAVFCLELSSKSTIFASHSNL